ncbi:HGGxSTG domain-containing protein [Hoeflea sp. CAU 1731]
MTTSHKRNTSAMQQSPRCGAKTRNGAPCRSPAVLGKTHCRMHGGSVGSGAPPGNKNAIKHGGYTREVKLVRKWVRDRIRESNDTLKDFASS